MSLAANNKTLASEIIALKTKVENEMKRRKYTGSVEIYGTSSSYLYSSADTPTNNKILAS